MKRNVALTFITLAILTTTAFAARPPKPDDLFSLRNLGEPGLSPDGRQIAYTVISIDREKNRYKSSIWLVSVSGGPSTQITDGEFSDSSPRWSPDGKTIALSSDRGGEHSLWTLDVASRQLRMLARWPTTNRFISKSGESLSWAPDSHHIAFVAAEDGVKSAAADPRVITRIQYKTRTSLADNLRDHIFIASLDGEPVRELTSGDHDEHSISWSPKGDEIAFLSNHEADPDSRLNYDIFAVNVKTGAIRSLTNTPGVEYSPVWSPDGNFIAYTATKRPLTTIDSIAEDTHIWVIGREGGTGTEVSSAMDRRCFAPEWSSDSRSSIYFLAGDHGRTLIYNVSREGGAVAPVAEGDFQVSSFSVGNDHIGFVRGDATEPGELWVSRLDGSGQSRLTSVNEAFAGGLKLSKPETVHFKSFDGTDIEGWLTRPLGFQSGKKYPMILNIHGGPHGMYGYSFNLSNQVLCANGYAVLYINPRGSSGYGQHFSDGCVNNWGGGDYQDLMRGVDYVLEANSWIDPDRLGVMGGSYGGFMTNWVITQTTRFKAAVAIASVSNLISFYATSLYQDLVHTEFNGFPWDNWDVLWKYSPIHYVKSVTTPTMFIHGEQDNDVHITQAEEMYMGLKRRGVESVFVRYPREGHGNREPVHRLDEEQRILEWFGRFLHPAD